MRIRRLHLGATMAMALVCAPAQAADVPVLGDDGRTSLRSDPGIAARDRTAVPPHRQVRPRATAAGRRTTLSELRRLHRAGQIDRSSYTGYRDEYNRAKALARRLTGRRRLELRGVIGGVDAMAARGALTASRLVPIWLQLARNREWWSTGPLLGAGQRVSFEGSELVFQYVPGQGLQIHPLANFGKLNALWRSRLEVDRMQQLMDELLPLAAGRAGGTAWEYYFDFGGGRAPWVSSLAQGTGLQSMARASTKAGETDLVFPTLRRGLAIFRTRTPSGVRVPTGSGIHYAQYSYAPGLRILNGFIQSLVGLYDFATIADDPTAQGLFEAGERRALVEVPTFDTGAWSLYSRGTSHHESDLNYHTLLTGFLVSLCDRTGSPVYCDAKANFRRYLREVPGVDFITREMEGGRYGTLRFRLSKISRVSMSVRREDTTVFTYTATMAYGSKSIPFKPPRKPGLYDVSVTATDLAGNTGTYADTIEIVRR